MGCGSSKPEQQPKPVPLQQQQQSAPRQPEQRQQQQQQERQKREQQTREQEQAQEREQRERLERQQREKDERQKHEWEQREQEQQEQERQKLEKEQLRQQERERRQQEEQQEQLEQQQRHEEEQQERKRQERKQEEQKRQEKAKEQERLEREEKLLLQRQQEAQAQERQDRERQEQEREREKQQLLEQKREHERQQLLEEQKQEQERLEQLRLKQEQDREQERQKRLAEPRQGFAHLEDSQHLTSSSSSTEAGATSTATSADETLAKPAPFTAAKAFNAGGRIASEAAAGASPSQPPKRSISATSQSSPPPAKRPIAWGTNKASFAEVLKKTGDQPVQPAKRPAQSQASRKPSQPVRSPPEPPPSRGRGGKIRQTSARPPVKASTPASSKSTKPPIIIQTAPPNDSDVSRLSRGDVGDYFVNSRGSTTTLGTDDNDVLDRFDFSGRLVDLQKTSAFGGLSDLMKGRIDGSNTVVAIKVLRMQDMGLTTQDVGDPQRLRLRKRLARELRIWLFLHHPRILESLGFAYLDNQPCLLSPWCENGNATRYLARHPNANRKTLVVQVAEGLLYLHSRDPAVIHADLKPLNILVNDGGDALICDFGISKLSGEATTGLTTSQDQFMSLRYAAPEILENETPTTKSDVYAFACVALELLTDRIPQFGATTKTALIKFVIYGPMSDPVHYPRLPAVSPLWGLFRKCWATNPKERPTMQEAHDELVRIPFE